MPMKFSEQGSKKLLRADFEDLYKSKCSIQEASERNQSAVWLGASFDFEGKPSTRMILSQDMVRELLPHLTMFAQTGYLKEANRKLKLPEIPVPQIPHVTVPEIPAPRVPEVAASSRSSKKTVKKTKTKPKKVTKKRAAKKVSKRRIL